MGFATSSSNCPTNITSMWTYQSFRKLFALPTTKCCSPSTDLRATFTLLLCAFPPNYKFNLVKFPLIFLPQNQPRREGT